MRAMSQRGRPASRGGRVIALTHGVAAGVLVAVLAAVALVVQPPAPPGIAEFAPSAAKPIEQAPQRQSSQFGSGADVECAETQKCMPASASPTVLPSPSMSALAGVPSALRCYRWPDGSVTQTFDRQSPPCIAAWDERRGNGGATTRGVDGRTVRVAWPAPKGSWGTYNNFLAPMLRFVNAHYQFYGRKLVIEPVEFPLPQSESARRSLAAQVVEQRVFATTTHGDDGSPSFPLAAAQRHVVTVLTNSHPTLREHQLRDHAPYLWAVTPTAEAVQRNAAEFGCTSLVGRRAEWAGAGSSDKLRRFVLGYTAPYGGAPEPLTEPLADGLRGCDAEVKAVRFDDGADGVVRRQQLVDLSRDGWTTVFWVGHGSGLNQVPRDASSIGYQPEWIELEGTTASGRSVGIPPEQRAHLMSMRPWNKSLLRAEYPGAQAWQIGGGKGQPPSSGWGNAFYRPLALLAAGIQMAGPNLTPQAFRAGLEQTTFPNPGAGSAPLYQASVGFTDGDATFADDYAIAWWDERVQDPDTAAGERGGYCYYGRGRRFRLGGWPRNLRLFTPGTPCR